jgi:hypothetical protein
MYFQTAENINILKSNRNQDFLFLLELGALKFIFGVQYNSSLAMKRLQNVFLIQLTRVSSSSQDKIAFVNSS